MQIFSPRSILVSMIMFVLISPSGRHVSTFLLSRAVTEKNMLIKDTTKELFILTFFFFPGSQYAGFSLLQEKELSLQKLLEDVGGFSPF